MPIRRFPLIKGGYWLDIWFKHSGNSVKLTNGEYKFLSYLNYPVLFLNAENVFTYSDVLIFKPFYPNL